MIPNREWIRQWVEKRPGLSSQVDLERYFTQLRIAGNSIEVARIGMCSVPSGELLVRDPIRYLSNREELPYFVTSPVGIYPLEVAFTRTEDGDILYLAVRLRFNYRPAVHFEQALTGEEEIESFDGGFYGFFSESGLGCICDELSRQAFCDFVEKWRQEHPDGRLYSDYFGPLFEQSRISSPEIQNEGGSFLNWTVPGTSYRIPMFQTGWGEGQYPVYWGQDEEGRVCQLVVWFVDLEEGENPEEAFDIRTNLSVLEPVQEGWKGRVRLRDWEGFFEAEDSYPLLVCSDVKSEEEAEIACEKLLTQQYAALDVMMTALLDRYPIMQLEYGHTMADNAPEMPNVLDKNDFSALLYPKRIVFNPNQNTIAAAFSCTWDTENGFAAIVRGETLVEMGNETLVPEWQTEQKSEPDQEQEESELTE